MLILNEENHKLKGTKHRIPPKLVDICFKIIERFPEHSHQTGYIKSKNVVENNGLMTMEWFKGMKHFFDKHVDAKDLDYKLAGGVMMKEYINQKLKQLTNSTPKTRKQHYNSPVKPLKPASNLSGGRGEKSSQALSMVKSLLSNALPNFKI